MCKLHLDFSTFFHHFLNPPLLFPLEAYEIQSDEERNIFVHELELFAKSIRKWSLKGYTQDEVEKLKARVVNTVKIGRNDPCICGSGKKYKKCCG